MVEGLFDYDAREMNKEVKDGLKPKHDMSKD